MRVVLDTNIFISGIFWQGKCSKIILLWREKKFDLIVSFSMLEEFVRVLKDFKIQMPAEAIREWVDMIINNSIVVEPEEKLDVVKSDIKDNIIVEAAVEGRVDFIVSQDNHLLELKEFRNIRIVGPEDFLNLFSD